MRKALASLPGVANVDVKIADMVGTVTVTVTPDEFSDAAAIEALAGVGFEGSTVQ